MYEPDELTQDKESDIDQFRKKAEQYVKRHDGDAIKVIVNLLKQQDRHLIELSTAVNQVSEMSSKYQQGVGKTNNLYQAYAELEAQMPALKKITEENEKNIKNTEKRVSENKVTLLQVGQTLRDNLSLFFRLSDPKRAELEKTNKMILDELTMLKLNYGILEAKNKSLQKELDELKDQQHESSSYPSSKSHEGLQKKVTVSIAHPGSVVISNIKPPQSSSQSHEQSDEAEPTTPKQSQHNH